MHIPIHMHSFMQTSKRKGVMLYEEKYYYIAVFLDLVGYPVPVATVYWRLG